MFNFPDADAQNSPDDQSANLSGRIILHAALDLQRLVSVLAQRHLLQRNAMPGYPAAAPTWRLLLAIEEQAFADPGFQARYPDAVRRGFARLADSRFAGSDIDAQVDWQRDDDPLPAVYAIMRALVQQQAAMTADMES
ncbi:hypothetical protein FHX57_006340 [Paraburkholderia tropica]|uniref:DUF2471 family protein n=1 Tax=Paraburkholderia tropica TaxID=92647 RepID=UPI001607685C|nr:DUF2471 family protein [Paraburkholderia tropica]MBB3003961.1 hypothetical protein [Paraburkholderia tropica]MBB6323443.1 hypothetical protein [Paraburkholderia tropica]